MHAGPAAACRSNGHTPGPRAHAPPAKLCTPPPPTAPQYLLRIIGERRLPQCARQWFAGLGAPAAAGTSWAVPAQLLKPRPCAAHRRRLHLQRSRAVAPAPTSRAAARWRWRCRGGSWGQIPARGRRRWRTSSFSSARGTRPPAGASTPHAPPSLWACSTPATECPGAPATGPSRTSRVSATQGGAAPAECVPGRLRRRPPACADPMPPCPAVARLQRATGRSRPLLGRCPAPPARAGCAPARPPSTRKSNTHSSSLTLGERRLQQWAGAAAGGRLARARTAPARLTLWTPCCCSPYVRNFTLGEGVVDQRQTPTTVLQFDMTSERLRCSSLCMLPSRPAPAHTWRALPAPPPAVVPGPLPPAV